MEHEKTSMNMDHKTCGWCGLDKGFSFIRLLLAIVLGLFIFFAGMVIGQMRGFSYGDGTMMRRHWNQDQGIIIEQQGATTVPATTLTPAR